MKLDKFTMYILVCGILCILVSGAWSVWDAHRHGAPKTYAEGYADGLDDCPVTSHEYNFADHYYNMLLWGGVPHAGYSAEWWGLNTTLAFNHISYKTLDADFEGWLDFQHGVAWLKVTNRSCKFHKGQWLDNHTFLSNQSLCYDLWVLQGNVSRQATQTVLVEKGDLNAAR